MANKKSLTMILAGLFLLLPTMGRGQDYAVFDQFADAFSAGFFQGALLDDRLSLESDSDTDATQGVNVIIGHLDGGAMQQALLEENLSLLVTNGDQVVQGVNVYRGSADEIAQIAIVSGSATLTSKGSSGGVQGINVITTCGDSCK